MALDKLVDSAQLDSDLGDVADAIRAKSGGSSPLAFPAGFVTEIDSIPTGGGGSGYTKKSGAFVLTENYVYDASLSRGTYSGSLLVDTGLSKIESIILWTEEWVNQTMDSANGVGCYFAVNKQLPVIGIGNSPSVYYPSYGAFKANTNYYYSYLDKGGIVLHSASADVPEGYFGFQCRSAAYPIPAGYTVRWEAWGEE